MWVGGERGVFPSLFQWALKTRVGLCSCVLIEVKENVMPTNGRSSALKSRQVLNQIIQRWPLCFEILEQRTLLSISVTGAPSWVEQGPGPIGNGFGVQQEMVGATNGIAADPFNVNLLFVGTVNGGI